MQTNQAYLFISSFQSSSSIIELEKSGTDYLNLAKRQVVTIVTLVGSVLPKAKDVLIGVQRKLMLLKMLMMHSAAKQIFPFFSAFAKTGIFFFLKKKKVAFIVCQDSFIYVLNCKTMSQKGEKKYALWLFENCPVHL